MMPVKCNVGGGVVGPVNASFYPVSDPDLEIGWGGGGGAPGPSGLSLAGSVLLIRYCYLCVALHFYHFPFFFSHRLNLFKTYLTADHY